MQGKRRDPYYQAQAILSRRDHSRFEVETKLRRKGFSAQQISVVIKQLQQQRLLNDERFTAMFIDSTLQLKPVGPRWLKSKLRQKGVASSLIDEHLARAFGDEREEELARRAAASWRRAHARHQDDTVRLARFLASRGFSQSSYSFLDRRMGEPR